MIKRIHTTLLALVAIVGSVSAQSLSVQPIEVQTGGQTEVVVSLTGATAMTALQFNLQLPTGLTATTDNVTLGAATNGHTLSVQTLASGDLLFVLYSMDLKAFKNGELLRIPVTTGNSATNATGKLYTIRTASISGEDAVSHACSNAQFNVTMTEPEPEPRPNVAGKTFTLHCARGYVYGDGTKLAGTADAAQASKFAIVTYNEQTYLYDATNKAFAVHSTAAKAGTTGNNTLESKTDLSKAVTGLSWGETGYDAYPFYLEDSFGNWLNMDGQKRVYMNTWKDFEGGVAGNTYAVTIVDTEFDATEAIAMLEAYTTGIGSVENETMRNGEKEKVFDLSGRKVAKPTKAIYIVNGRKVLIK